MALYQKSTTSEMLSQTETENYVEDNALQELLPNNLNKPLRQRGHEFELQIIRTERYKRAFINRCL